MFVGVILEIWISMLSNKSILSAMYCSYWHQPVLIAGVLVAGATLVAGSARATTWTSSCEFGPTAGLTACIGPVGAGSIWTTTPGFPAAPGNPPLQLDDKLLNINSYSFADYSTGLLTNPSGRFQFSYNDQGNPACNDSQWDVRTIFDITVTGIIGQNATGTLNYTLSIVPPTCTFKSVVLDSATVGTETTVTKSIAGLISPLISNNGSTSVALLGGTSINVTDTYSVIFNGTISQGLNSFNNGYTQTNAIPVPGPLPLLGVGAAFGFIRRLRNRIKRSWLA